MYWCFDCGSSLAEFEIEYADKKSTTLDVGFQCAEPDKLAAALACQSSKDAFAVIWTTTAWTIPANQALNLNPDPRTRWWTPKKRGSLLVANSLVGGLPERYGSTGERRGHRRGEKLVAFSMHRCDVDAGYRPLAPPISWPTT